MSTLGGGADTGDGASVALAPALPGLTMLGTTDAGTCADGQCAVPGAGSST